MRISDWSSDVCSSDLPGQRSSPADRNAFSQKIVDFVVQDPNTGKIVALIEVDDWSHSAARNRIRDVMTAGAGYRTFHIPASARPTIQDRKSTRLNSSHLCASRMPSSAR